MPKRLDIPRRMKQLRASAAEVLRDMLRDTRERPTRVRCISRELQWERLAWAINETRRSTPEAQLC